MTPEMFFAIILTVLATLILLTYPIAATLYVLGHPTHKLDTKQLLIVVACVLSWAAIMFTLLNHFSHSTGKIL